MRIFITGEKGFIGRNLVRKLKDFNFDHVSSDAEITTPNDIKLIFHKPGELCVHQNDITTWKEFFFRNKVDVVIHNAAVVGTDVVALNASEATIPSIIAILFFIFISPLKMYLIKSNEACNKLVRY